MPTTIPGTLNLIFLVLCSPRSFLHDVFLPSFFNVPWITFLFSQFKAILLSISKEQDGFLSLEIQLMMVQLLEIHSHSLKHAEYIKIKQVKYRLCDGFKVNSVFLRVLPLMKLIMEHWLQRFPAAKAEGHFNANKQNLQNTSVHATLLS